jgi:hypothetical protein
MSVLKKIGLGACHVVAFLFNDERGTKQREEDDLSKFSDGIGTTNISGEHMTQDEAKAHRRLFGTDYDY